MTLEAHGAFMWYQNNQQLEISRESALESEKETPRKKNVLVHELQS